MAGEPVAIIADEVREFIRRSGVDPTREPEQVRRLVDEVVADYDERVLTSGLTPLHDRPAASRSV